MDINKKLADELGVNVRFINQTVSLIDEGNTIPFIARYRKEMTGGMSDVILRELMERLTYLRNLEARKEEVLKSIEEQGKLTEEIRSDIEKAEILQRVEDLYKPFKQKKSTRAGKARERGLEPLAETVLSQELTEGRPEDAAEAYVDPEKDVADVQAALAGASDIIAERTADDPENVEMVRNYTREHGTVVSEAVDKDEKTPYEMYYEYAEAVKKIPDHRVQAVNRGEKEKKLKVKIAADADKICSMLREKVITNERSIFADLISAAVDDAYKRLMAPSVERELRNELTERAEKESIKVFAANTKSLLMQKPVRDARVLAIDPGQRTGCKLAALGSTGKLLAYATIYPTPPKKDIAGSERIITKLIDKFDLNTIVIGNGTGSRETEKFIADYIAKTGRDLKYTFVSEAGASVYSASKLASEEYPDLDVTTRGAMSIGRRLQDPLSELVKIPPRSMGIGQYQHDVDKAMLDSALADVVEDCVNNVGVDLNTASPSLLSYVAGINSLTAKNIVKYREENGAFTNRKQLLKVPRLGAKTYSQCAGFLRITGGDNPLDATAVHPESYETAEKMLDKLGIDPAQIASGGVADIDDKICRVYPVPQAEKRGESEKSGDRRRKDRRNRHTADSSSPFAVLAVLLEDEEKEYGKRKKKSRNEKAKKESEDKARLRDSMKLMADDLDMGLITLTDIVSEIKKPARDPRDEMPPVIFRQDVLSFEDLAPGMTMEGTVRNVVDFGAFVDIGVKTDGLVHISEMSNKYIKHPTDVVSVGDVVKVRILDIDIERHKISLSMKL
ncbi:MAG: Tex family protein [Anaerovoracaceae bacterium]|nr:Tex family protein [Bacillota bacterium]MDY2671523.1 Tex family protein [Anaerovoracaceae bacterium]